MLFTTALLKMETNFRIYFDTDTRPTLLFKFRITMHPAGSSVNSAFRVEIRNSDISFTMAAYRKFYF